MDLVHESGPWTWSKVGVHGPLVHVLSSPVSQSVICVAGLKRVEGGRYVTLIPSLSRPAMQVTESNKGVSCVVMLQGPVKGEFR